MSFGLTVTLMLDLVTHPPSAETSVRLVPAVPAFPSTCQTREEAGLDLSRNLLASLGEVRRRDRSRDREQEPEKPAPGGPEER